MRENHSYQPAFPSNSVNLNRGKGESTNVLVLYAVATTKASARWVP